MYKMVTNIVASYFNSIDTARLTYPDYTREFWMKTMKCHFPYHSDLSYFQGTHNKNFTNFTEPITCDDFKVQKYLRYRNKETQNDDGSRSSF